MEKSKPEITQEQNSYISGELIVALTDGRIIMIEAICQACGQFGSVDFRQGTNRSVDQILKDIGYVRFERPDEQGKTDLMCKRCFEQWQKKTSSDAEYEETKELIVEILSAMSDLIAPFLVQIFAKVKVRRAQKLLDEYDDNDDGNGDDDGDDS